MIGTGGIDSLEQVKPMRAGRMLRGLAAVIVFVALAFALAGNILLDKAGNFLAPRLTGKADAVILEGEELLQQGVVVETLKLMTERHIERLILVTHRYSEARRAFGISDHYNRLVEEELQRHGVKKERYLLISVPVEHPITLTEAKAVFKTLSKESIKSAVLVASGFHMRRSYLVYRGIGRTQDIQIIPWSSSASYPLAKWWINEDAVADFLTQLAKLSYYLLHGHIPITAMFQNE